MLTDSPKGYVEVGRVAAGVWTTGEETGSTHKADLRSSE